MIKLHIREVVTPWQTGTWPIYGMTILHVYAATMLENLLFFWKPKTGAYFYIFRTFTWRP